MFNDKTILITGVAGTIGRALLNKLANKYNCKKIIGIDNNESELFFVDQDFTSNDSVFLYLADIQSQADCTHFTKGIDIVFHCAALKHVILCEKSPMYAVTNNLIGLENLIKAANDNCVEKFIFTSSDKAVNPTNVMGTSKLMGERLVTASSSKNSNSNIIFSSTRFGNVLGSNGSVIPIFKKQIKKGGPVTLTDEQMTRFIMSIDDAVELVLNSSAIAQGGEVFVTKMPVITIQSLAEVMIDKLALGYGFNPKDIEIKVIGSKPGEKLYEELMTDEETVRSVELDKYFSVLPSFKCEYKNVNYNYENIVSKNVNDPYVSMSQEKLTKKELEMFLINNNLI